MYNRTPTAFHIFWLCGIIGVLADAGDFARIFLGAPDNFSRSWLFLFSLAFALFTHLAIDGMIYRVFELW